MNRRYTVRLGPAQPQRIQQVLELIDKSLATSAAQTQADTQPLREAVARPRWQTGTAEIDLDGSKAPDWAERLTQIARQYRLGARIEHKSQGEETVMSPAIATARLRQAVEALAAGVMPQGQFDDRLADKGVAELLQDVEVALTTVRVAAGVEQRRPLALALGPEPLGLSDAIATAHDEPDWHVWQAELGLFHGEEANAPFATHTVYAAAPDTQAAMEWLREVAEDQIAAVDGVAFSLVSGPRVVPLEEARSLCPSAHTADPAP